ncbi:hypothetical protein [Kineococcus gypseus]|uniref:hypothetical protein n=1 Tax=Kineococcus gypseus TaxID=1637102 RepID=UPI003D7E575F
MSTLQCLTCATTRELPGSLDDALRAAKAHHCPGRPYPLRVPPQAPVPAQAPRPRPLPAPVRLPIRLATGEDAGLLDGLTA